MGSHSIPVSTGEYMDRMAVLWTKVGRFVGSKRHRSLRLFYELEKGLTIPPDKEASVNVVYRQLLDLHQSLFDTEDEIRAAAAKMPNQIPGSTKGWFDTAVTSDITRSHMIRHSQAAYTISLSNEKRHELITQINMIMGENSEPKEYNPTPK